MFMKFRALASIAGVGLFAAACVPAEDQCDAATIQTVQLAATLAIDAAHNGYYLSTPSTARSACDAHYHLAFRWAATPRDLTDTSTPPLSNLADAFHVDADTMYWYHVPATLSTNPGPLTWVIDFYDHNAVATSPQSQYYIRTGLPSGGPGDSVYVSGQIDYYPK